MHHSSRFLSTAHFVLTLILSHDPVLRDCVVRLWIVAVRCLGNFEDVVRCRASRMVSPIVGSDDLGWDQ